MLTRPHYTHQQVRSGTSPWEDHLPPHGIPSISWITCVPGTWTTVLTCFWVFFLEHISLPLWLVTSHSAYKVPHLPAPPGSPPSTPYHHSSPKTSRQNHSLSPLRPLPLGTYIALFNYILSQFLWLLSHQVQRRRPDLFQCFMQSKGNLRSGPMHIQFSLLPAPKARVLHLSVLLVPTFSQVNPHWDSQHSHPPPP